MQKLGSERTSYLAFADYVVLTASTHPGLQAALDHLMGSAECLGLEVGVNKCATQRHKKKKSWVQDSSPFYVERQPVWALAPGSFYTWVFKWEPLEGWLT